MGKIYNCKTFKEVMEMIIDIFGIAENNPELEIHIEYEYAEMCYTQISVEFVIGGSSGWKRITFPVPEDVEDIPVNSSEKSIEYKKWLNGEYPELKQEDWEE